MNLTEEDREFVETQRLAHLATVDLDGVPHLVPICFALRNDRFYFVIDDKPKRTHWGLKRLRNIARDGRIALVIDRYDDDWRRLRYIQVWGLASIVTDAAEYASALVELERRYLQYRRAAFSFETHPLVRITPQRLHRWQFSAPQSEEVLESDEKTTRC